MSRNSWTFHSPTRIVFGRGAVRHVGDVASGRTLLICSPGATERGLTERVVELIGADRVLVHDRVESDPSVRSLDASIEQLRGEPVETIVAVGGGSAIDTGKVVSLALATGGASVSASWSTSTTATRARRSCRSSPSRPRPEPEAR